MLLETLNPIPKESILAYVAKHGLRAAAVVSCVGSLSKARALGVLGKKALGFRV